MVAENVEELCRPMKRSRSSSGDYLRLPEDQQYPVESEGSEIEFGPGPRRKRGRKIGRMMERTRKQTLAREGLSMSAMLGCRRFSNRAIANFFFSLQRKMALKDLQTLRVVRIRFTCLPDLNQNPRTENRLSILAVAFQLSNMPKWTHFGYVGPEL